MYTLLEYKETYEQRRNEFRGFVLYILFPEECHAKSNYEQRGDKHGQGPSFPMQGQFAERDPVETTVQEEDVFPVPGLDQCKHTNTEK